MDDKYEEIYYEKFTFKCEDSNGYSIEINKTCEEGNIVNAFDAFILFLKGCGYGDEAIRKCINLDELEV